MWRFLSALALAASICGFHRSLESSVTPRYLTSFTKGTDIPRRESLLSRFHLRFLVNMMASVLMALSFTPIEEHQESMMLR